jgi:hypothetical protein
MPFTPIHMGPGMALKAAIPEYFSIIVFGMAQIAIDIEVLWYIVSGAPPLHRFWHTYMGATLVAICIGFIGKPLSQWLKLFWNRIAANCRDANVSVSVPTTWSAAFIASFIGAYSHILLDSLFHWDIHPLQPWFATNHLQGIIRPHTIELVCILLGIVGLVWFFKKEWREKKDKS